ncbi:MAG: hypothetical protein FJ280_26375 [Planctomycetes bacterium]|nr:hypothetical protein [Planctomycetota bacterium]
MHGGPGGGPGGAGRADREDHPAGGRAGREGGGAGRGLAPGGRMSRCSRTRGCSIWRRRSTR